MKKNLCLLIMSLCVLISACSKIENKQIKNEFLKPKQENKEVQKYSKSQLMLLDLHNEQRENKKINKLSLDEKLCEYAQKHAEKMANDDNLFHSSMNSLMKTNDKNNVVGENVAFGQESEKEVVGSWLRSVGHRWNILNKKYGKVGFGIAKNQDGKVYWCAVFTN